MLVLAKVNRYRFVIVVSNNCIGLATVREEVGLVLDVG